MVEGVAASRILFSLSLLNILIVKARNSYDVAYVFGPLEKVRFTSHGNVQRNGPSALKFWQSLFQSISRNNSGNRAHRVACTRTLRGEFRCWELISEKGLPVRSSAWSAPVTITASESKVSSLASVSEHYGAKRCPELVDRHDADWRS